MERSEFTSPDDVMVAARYDRNRFLCREQRFMGLNTQLNGEGFRFRTTSSHTNASIDCFVSVDSLLHPATILSPLIHGQRDIIENINVLNKICCKPQVFF